jgi:hypothetical protein
VEFREGDIMIERLRGTIRDALPRDLVLDLEDGIVADAKASHEIVRDHTRLNPKRAREAVGQLRFRMQEQTFHEICERHGGVPLCDGLLPGSELRVFQPFMRFQGAGVCVILGFASMPGPHEVPVKNQSRGAGVTLNYHVTPRLDFDGIGPKPDDIFVLFLAARDPTRAGRVQEVAIGLIDSAYQGFVFYEPIEEFLTAYASERAGEPAPEAVPLARLRSRPNPFVRPEQLDDHETPSGSEAI